MKKQIVLSTLIVAGFAMPALADIDCPAPTDNARAIEDARLYIEDNVPDTDIGVHGFFGDTAWTILCVYGPDGKELLSFEPGGAFAEQGIAEFFFESNEPPYEDWGYDALKVAFPDGDYPVHALDVDGTVLTGAARFTSKVALAPVITSPETTRDEGGDIPVVPAGDVAVQWEPATQSRDGRPVTIVGYQIVMANTDWTGTGDTFAKPAISVHVGADKSELIVSESFFDPDTVYDLEVIAIEDSGNQTIAGVSFFKTPG